MKEIKSFWNIIYNRKIDFFRLFIYLFFLLLIYTNSQLDVMAATNNLQEECTESNIGAWCPSKFFSDLDLSEWYHLEVDYVVKNEIMKGVYVEPGELERFAPDMITTRGMIVTMLYRMEGAQVTEQQRTECVFTDVERDAYYADAVAWAASEGIVQGISDDLFAPNERITREQMVLMLYRYAAVLGKNVEQKTDLSFFEDEEHVSSWAKDAVSWANAVSLLGGIPTENGTLEIKPQGETPRCQAAAFIHRFCMYNANVPLAIAECRLKESEKDDKYTLHIEISGLHTQNNNVQYYIVQLDSYEKEVADSFNPIVVDNKEISIELSRNEVMELIMGKYALASIDANGQYQLVTEPVSIVNPEFIATNKLDFADITSKKGLQGVGFDVAADTNSKHTLFNLDLAKVVGNGPAEGYSEYVYKGKTYYFSDCNNLVGEFRALEQGYEQYIQGTTGEKNKVAVSLCLLLSYDSVNNYLIDPAARAPGYRYYTLNVREQEARETLEAVFLYLGELFGQEDCYVTNWILGNEVNSSRAYNYSGSLDFDTYIECYATVFRLLYNGVKAQKTANNVYISLDNGWTATPDTYAGKATLDKFAECINQIDSNVEWNVAYHGYSYPLTRNDFWNDASNTTFDLSTRYISMKNISVLTDYVAALEEKYNKERDSIRVILSEQGYNASNRDDVKAESQARALARGYYMAEFNDRVDAFIIRAIIDDEEEMKGGLFFGLKNWQDIKRITFYTYEFMDSSLEKFSEKLPNQIAGSTANQEKVGVAQEILCGSNWESMIPGFSRIKLAEMK